LGADSSSSLSTDRECVRPEGGTTEGGQGNIAGERSIASGGDEAFIGLENRAYGFEKEMLEADALCN
jgi:hypothetical protein